MRRKTERDKKNGIDVMTHQSESIVARNIHQKPQMNAGNWRRIKILIHQCGNPIKALDWVRGPRKKQRHGNKAQFKIK
jgi:hypothetical protein